MAQALSIALGEGEDVSCTQVVTQPTPGTGLCNCRAETPNLSQGPCFALSSGPANSVASPAWRFYSVVRGHRDTDRMFIAAPFLQDARAPRPQHG